GGVEGVDVGITIRELAEPGKCKVSVRSGPQFDSNALCSRFGGGGHFMAAGLSRETDVDNMRALLLDALKDTFGE
ncbi:MAG: phosphoesterase RecJ domain-containing protein, partial [Oscillospiraceae bacterium]|nr:phosphoesterase RecJ domain-containing protein [Oscillospiraceae bacterium]